MMSVGRFQFRHGSHWNQQIFTQLFIALAENKLYMMHILLGEKLHINALFPFAFSSALK